jgi:hypothetical protein
VPDRNPEASKGPAPEDSKSVFRRIRAAQQAAGPYFQIYELLERNPNLSASGRVYVTNHHYVHERSTSVEINVEGYLGDGADEQDITNEVYGLFGEMQDSLGDDVVDWNRKLTGQLYKELEENQTDEAIIDWLDNNDRRFDDEGDEVDLTDFVPVDNLKPGIRNKVVREYADLFDRTTQQVYTALMQRGLRFDRHGNRVDVSRFKRVSELPEDVRKRILDKYRDVLVEDEFWSEALQDDWQQKLEEMGFERVKIRYSLGYAQGDGASFTADSIDVRKLCLAMMQQKKVEAAAHRLVGTLLS